MKADEACECFGVDQAIHMDSLNAFIDSQISASNKNSMFWYDYLNPSHRQIHAKVMRFVQGTEMAHHSVHSPTQPIQQLRLIKKNREKDIMKRTCQIGEYNEFIYFAKPIIGFLNNMKYVALYVHKTNLKQDIYFPNSMEKL